MVDELATSRPYSAKIRPETGWITLLEITPVGTAGTGREGELSGSCSLRSSAVISTAAIGFATASNAASEPRRGPGSRFTFATTVKTTTTMRRSSITAKTRRPKNVPSPSARRGSQVSFSWFPFGPTVALVAPSSDGAFVCPGVSDGAAVGVDASVGACVGGACAVRTPPPVHVGSAGVPAAVPKTRMPASALKSIVALTTPDAPEHFQLANALTVA